MIDGVHDLPRRHLEREVNRLLTLLILGANLGQVIGWICRLCP